MPTQESATIDPEAIDPETPAATGPGTIDPAIDPKKRVAELIERMLDELGRERGAKISDTLEYVRAALPMKTTDAIQKWRQANAVPNNRALEGLARLGVREARMSHAWAAELLEAAGYPRPERLLEELATVPRPNVQHNLPARPYRQFVPRNSSLYELHDALANESRYQNIAVEGQNGVGKTALALEVAWRYVEGTMGKQRRDRFDTIVWISFKRSVITSRGEVPTRPLSASTSQEDEAPVRTRSMPVTRDEVLRTIARVAGGSSGRSDTSGPKRSPAQEAAEALMSAKRTLIVLDQVEELPDFDKLELVSLLEFFKGLSLPIKVLVTSARYVSDIALPLKLGPMSDKEMGELIDQFADRHLVDIPSEEREKLLRNAQGLPLVAEWAVGRIALGETPSAVVEQIKASATTLAPVMNYIFAASRTYLEEDADAREVLRTLALFHPHTPVGARTVATGAGVSESTALAALRQLYMHHLVHQTTGPRYSLAPSMQERAVALLHDLDVPPRDDAEVRLRMLQEYFEVARQWGGPDWVPQRKDRDYPFLDQEWAALCELSRWYIDRSKNLGANARGKRTQEEWDKIAEDFACMWIVSLPVYAEVRGHWRVCEEFLTAVQIRLGAVHEQRLGATIALARFAALRGDRDAAHIFLDRAAPALRRASAQERYAYLNTRVLASLRGARPDASGAWTEADDADFDEAYTEFRRAVEQKHTLSPDDQRRHVIDLRRYQGFMQQRRGNIGEAHTAYAQMLKYANGRWKRAELHAECLLAGTARRLGNLSETKRLLEDAEQLETDLKDMPGRALLLAEQAAYLRERKRTAQADQREEESKRLDHTMRGDAA